MRVKYLNVQYIGSLPAPSFRDVADVVTHFIGSSLRCEYFRNEGNRPTVGDLLCSSSHQSKGWSANTSKKSIIHPHRNTHTLIAHAG